MRESDHSIYISLQRAHRLYGIHLHFGPPLLLPQRSRRFDPCQFCSSSVPFPEQRSGLFDRPSKLGSCPLPGLRPTPLCSRRGASAEMMHHEICPFSNANLRQYDRLVPELAVGWEQPVVLGDRVGQPMPPLGVRGEDFWPGWSHEHLPMVALTLLQNAAVLRGRSRFDDRCP